MSHTKNISKRDFIQHTSQYLKMVESGEEVIITHQNTPSIKLKKIKTKSIYDLEGIAGEIKVIGDINEPILPGYDKW